MPDFPYGTSLDEMQNKLKLVRKIIRKYDEVESINVENGRPDDGTDPSGFFHVEMLVPLKPFKDWPAVKKNSGWLSWLQPHRPRTKDELSKDMNDELNRTLIGVDWTFSQNVRDNVMEALSGVKGIIRSRSSDRI